MTKRSKGKGLPDSVTQERATREQNDVRVRVVVGMMADGSWFSGRSHLAKSLEWDVGIDQVEKVASLASKVIRVMVNLDPEDVKARMVCALEEHRRLALDKERTLMSKDGEAITFADADLKAANQSVAIQAQLLGLVTSRVNLTVDAQRIAAMTPAERLEECLRVRAELELEIAGLRKQLKGRAA